MREDMFHVIIDRPRTGGDGGKSYDPKGYKKRHQKTPLDEQAKHESTARGRRYGWECKRLNEHLGPLRRYLRKQCGRPWNEVHSEICENISIDSATQSHVRDHVDSEVEQHVQLIGNKVFTTEGHELWRDFFVHPETGKLCFYERKHERRVRTRKFIEKDKDHHYQPINGVWYEIELADLPPVQPWTGSTASSRWSGQEYFHDLVLNATLSRYELRNEYGRECRAIKKRQLNGKEIKKLGLWDTPLGILTREEIDRNLKEQQKKAG